MKYVSKCFDPDLLDEAYTQTPWTGMLQERLNKSPSMFFVYAYLSIHDMAAYGHVDPPRYVCYSVCRDSCGN